MRTGLVNGETRRKIKFFPQHAVENQGIGMETCGASCALMAIQYFDHRQVATIAEEIRLYRGYGAQVTRGMLASGVARAVAAKGLDVRIVFASEYMMEYQQAYCFTAEEHKRLLARCAKQLEEGSVPVAKGIPITCDTLREELAQERLVIVQILLGEQTDALRERVMHWILLYDADETQFYICDPERGKRTMTDEELAQRMKTPFGAVYISVGKNNQRIQVIK